MSPMAINDPSPPAARETNGIHALKSAATTPKTWKPVQMSSLVSRIANPIREIVANMDFNAVVNSDDPKPLLNLGLGDPSVYGNFKPPAEALTAIENSLRSGKADGYPESIGYGDAREAVAQYFDESDLMPGENNWKISKKDVVLTHGASGGLEMAIAVLSDTHKNVVFPCPLFTCYETLTSATTNAEIRYYDLLPEKNWEIDLQSLEKVCDSNTAFIMLNNPSNPCGANYSQQHLKEIAAFAARKQIIVVSDEVYAGMAWRAEPAPPSASWPIQEGRFNRGMFTPYASVCGDSPAIIVGAVSKRWLAPGWRCGWLIVHDPQNILASVREGFNRWAFRIQGPSSTMQRALPELLTNTPTKFFTETMSELSAVGTQLHARLSKIPGLKPLIPQGAMYSMVGGLENFGFKNDKEFVTEFFKEERVFVLPGSAFRLNGYMRFVTTVPLDRLMQAADRLEAFCERHRVQ